MATVFDVPVPAAPFTKYVLSSFWRRAFALIIDGIVVLIAGGIVALFLRSAGSPVSGDLIKMLVGAGYFIYFNGRGDTMGKSLLGIRVVDAAGNAPGMRRAAIRYVLPGLTAIGGLPLFAPGLLFLDPIDALFAAVVIWVALSLLWTYDYLQMIWHPQKQTLHDLMAGTYVIRE
jgi:uncharacterized RDD family membrane protein YckC